MVFYRAFHFVCMLLSKRLFISVCALLVIAGPVYRALHVESELDYLYGYIACFDAIAIGCLTAIAAPHVRLPAPWASGLTMLASIALAAVYLSGIGGCEVLGFTGIALSTAALILLDAQKNELVTRSSAQAFARWPAEAIRWMGRHSYELYLFHIIVLGLLRDRLGRDDLARAWKWPLLVGFFLLSCGVAAALARLVSGTRMRALWLRKR